MSIWAFRESGLRLEANPTNIRIGDADEAVDKDTESNTVPQVASLVATYETGNRITCLKAFVLLESPEPTQSNGDNKAEDEFLGFSSSSERASKP